MRWRLTVVFFGAVLLLTAISTGNLGAEITAPAGITKLPDGTILIDDAAFPLASPTGSVEKDPAASNGTFTRLNGKFSWGIQTPLPPYLLEEGREYLVEARIRVKPILPEKDNWAGVIGVHDYTANQGIGQHSFTTKSLGSGWVDFPVVSFIATSGDSEAIWVGEESDFIEYIDIDWFKLTPLPFPVLDAYRNMLQEKPGTVNMFVRAGKGASSGIELVGVEKGLSGDLYLGTSSDPNLWSNGWAGIVVDYYVPGKGYILRRLLYAKDSYGRGWRGTIEPSLIGGSRQPLEIDNSMLPGDLKPGQWTNLSFDLAGNAPVGWNGRIWLTLVAQGTKDSTSLAFALRTPAASQLNIVNTWRHHSEDSWDDYALLDAPGRDLKKETALTTTNLLVRTVENAAQQKKESLPPLLVRFEPSTRLIFRDEPRLAWAEQDQAVEGLKLSAARNEYESGQAVFINPGQKSVVLSAVEPQDLKQASGKGTIPGQDIRVALVDYVYQGDVISGKWIPDGLPPFRSIEIPAGKYQPVWITARIAKQTPPGKYSGSISFKTKDGQKIAVPIEIRVANAALPDKSRLKTSFWINELAAAGQFYGKKPFKINDIMPYLDLMATHRISLSHIGFHVTPRSELAVDVEPMTTIYREKDGSFSFDFTNYDKLISAVYDRKMNVFNLGIGGATYSGWEYFDVTDRETGKVERYKPGASWENRKDWLNLAEMDSFVGNWTSALWNRYKDKYREILVYQGDDEPTPERYQSVVDLYTKVGKWAPGLPRLITKHPGEKMAPVVDIWVPLDVFFDPAASIAEQKKGKTMWWYVIGSRLSLGLSPLEARTLPWTTFKYNLSGLLYWGVNTGWTRNVAENPADRWPYKPWVLPGNPPQDETGFLIYPGPDGPVSSQRLENLRDGVEEYDLLYQLKEQVKSAEAKGITSGQWYEAASSLVKIPEEIAPERRRSLTEPARMDYWREKLLDLLENAPN